MFIYITNNINYNILILSIFFHNKSLSISYFKNRVILLVFFHFIYKLLLIHSNVFLFKLIKNRFLHLLGKFFKSLTFTFFF